MFKSVSTRPTNLSTDPSFPSPTAYNSADYRSIGKQNLQGGSPNNVLVLQRAEQKKVLDSLFPFLVQQRMQESK